MARDGMAELILKLREQTATTADEYTAYGQTFWSDAQLESHLDRHRTPYEREVLESVTDYNNGTAVYTRYRWREENVERAVSGSAAWKVENSRGSAIGTASYSVDYDAREITFNANTENTTYYLSYRSYDLDRAAAAVWDAKAAHVSDRFDIKTDNHDLKRSQMRTAFLEMAALCRKTAKPKHIRLTREDVW